MSNETQPLTTAQLAAHTQEFIGFLNTLADIYEQGAREGLGDKELYDTTRDKLAEILGLPLLQAANLTRVVIAIVGKRYGLQAYDRDEFKIIAARAMGATA